MKRPESDDELLDRVQRGAIGYFLEQGTLGNGLVADTSRSYVPCSMAVVGLALAFYRVGVVRGWITRPHAAACALVARTFFCDSPQSGDIVYNVGGDAINALVELESAVAAVGVKRRSRPRRSHRTVVEVLPRH